MSHCVAHTVQSFIIELKFDGINQIVLFTLLTVQFDLGAKNKSKKSTTSHSFIKTKQQNHYTPNSEKSTRVSRRYRRHC